MLGEVRPSELHAIDFGGDGTIQHTSPPSPGKPLKSGEFSLAFLCMDSASSQCICEILRGSCHSVLCSIMPNFGVASGSVLSLLSSDCGIHRKHNRKTNFYSPASRVSDLRTYTLSSLIAAVHPPHPTSCISDEWGWNECHVFINSSRVFKFYLSAWYCNPTTRCVFWSSSSVCF